MYRKSLPECLVILAACICNEIYKVITSAFFVHFFSFQNVTYINRDLIHVFKYIVQNVKEIVRPFVVTFSERM